MIKAIPSTGKPTAVNTIASMIRPAPGTAAVPILASTAVNTTVISAVMDKSTEKTCAIKIVATPCIIAVPSMLIVAPSGCTNELIERGTPSFFCAISIATGSVALLLDVLNDTAIAGEYVLITCTGLRFAKNFIAPP